MVRTAKARRITLTAIAARVAATQPMRVKPSESLRPTIQPSSASPARNTNSHAIVVSSATRSGGELIELLHHRLAHRRGGDLGLAGLHDVAGAEPRVEHVRHRLLDQIGVLAHVER